MNLVALTGRLARDPELVMVGEKGIPTAFFTLAVDRYGSDQADFIDCKVVGENRAEKFAEHNKKGRQIEVQGHLQAWLEETEEGVRGRYVVNVDTYRSGPKPKSAKTNAQE